MHLDGIKNIIFDLGRVIIDISENAAIEAFVQLGAKDIDQLYSRMKQADLFHQHEIGAIGKSAFIDTIRNHLNINKTDQDILNAWDTMLIGIPTARKVLLEQLSTNYRLFLLSNTKQAAQTLNTLKQIGVIISLDDFGFAPQFMLYTNST